MTTPLVSVVMPVRNVERYVDEAVASIQAQTFPQWELLVCDDASTDTTGARIARWCRSDPRIRSVTNERRLGIARSLNRLCRRAQGSLIARMDGDDVSEPERLEAQVAHFSNVPDLALCGTRASMIDEEGNRLGSIDVPTGSEEIKTFFYADNPFVHSSVMFRKDALWAVAGYPEDEVFEDYALWIEFAARGRVENLSRELVRHRVLHDSYTGSFSGSRNRLERLRLQIRALQKFGISHRAAGPLARSAASVLVAGARR